MNVSQQTHGIKVNHLPHDITSEQVTAYFEPYGSIANVSLKEGENERYAFVNFHSKSCALTAVERMNNTVINGKRINCKAQGGRSGSVGEYVVKVTCVSKSTTPESLSNVFSFGNSDLISSVSIIPCGAANAFNYAYVNYFAARDAQKATASLDQWKLDGSCITVKLYPTSPDAPIATQPINLPQSSRLPESQSYHCSPPPHHSSPPVYRSSLPVYHSSPPVYHSSPPVYRSSLPVYHSSPPVYHPSPPAYHLSPPAYHSSPPRQSYVPKSAGIKQPMPAGRDLAYKMSHSTVPHTARVTRNSTPSVDLRKQVSQPFPASSRPMHSTSPQSSTVKVSVYGELSSDDLEEVFSRFGEVLEKPIICRGSPNFCYVNFASSHAAVRACGLHNTTVKGIRVEVKVSQKQRSAGGPKQESRAVQCRPLVASILQTRHKEELVRLEKEHEVSLKPSHGSIKVWGRTEQVTAVDLCLQILVKRLEGEISVKDRDLPCHSVPLFEQDSAIDCFRKIEAKHGVEFCILQNTPQPMPVDFESFGKKVKECFTPTTSPVQSSSSDAIPMCSDLASFMKEKPHEAASSDTESVWLWENDAGSGFASYTPEISAKLNEELTHSSSGRIPLIIGSYSYLINFTNMTQTNIDSGRSRPIVQAQRDDLLVQWFYRDDSKEYITYTAEESAEIEQMFQSKIPRSLVINGNNYAFDFTAMTQSNEISMNSRKIERRVQVNRTKRIPNSERVITVQASGMPPSLGPAMDELQSTVADATIKKECRLLHDCSDDFKARLIQNMNKYFVTTRLVDKSLKLMGMPRYVERVHLLAEQERISDYEQCMQSFKAMGEKEPSNWEPQSGNLSLNPVKRNSDEWNKEVQSFHKTLSRASVTKLERIQNKWLWDHYSFEKKQMSKKNRGCVNEKHLFHGTRTTPPEKVFKSEKGVDFRFSKAAGLWGEGSYFAVNASYSDNYAHPLASSTTKQMLICKVLTGECYNAETKTDRSLRQPPTKPSSGSFEEERYDSVKGHTNGSYVYIVYDHGKVYPAYLVTYRMPSY